MRRYEFTVLLKSGETMTGTHYGNPTSLDELRKSQERRGARFFVRLVDMNVHVEGWEVERRW